LGGPKWVIITDETNNVKTRSSSRPTGDEANDARTRSAPNPTEDWEEANRDKVILELRSHIKAQL
jgi:hypothetical protein